MTTPTTKTAPCARPAPAFDGLRTAGLLTTIVLAALIMAATAVDAVRSGMLQLGEGPVTDAIPASFYGAAVLPDLLVHNVGWVIALGVLMILGAGAALTRSIRS